MVTGEATADVSAAPREQRDLGDQQPKLSLTDILRLGAAGAVNDSTCPQVQSVLAKISLCRTHVMGGRKFQCRDCDEVTSLYNSCGDRHCPTCSGGKRVDFNDRASNLILPGVTYYQVVFTLPSELSELALANREEMADLLVGSAWKSLSTQIKAEQDYDPAAISVLHTWNQKLEAHWHVHLLVPGEGPRLNHGKGLSRPTWKQATAPPGAKNSDGFHLVRAAALRETYRTRAIAKLRRLRRAGKLKLGGKFEHLQEDEHWDAFIEKLESKNWVAFIQPPPAATSSATQVVNYLTRYLTGGPISDHRITSANGREVTFLAREGVKAGGDRRQVPITLKTSDFVRRWCLHIQPDQLTKTRYFGGWSNNRQATYSARCQELLESLGRDVSTVDEATCEEEHPDLLCEHCGSDRLELVAQTAKPSWKELMWRESDSCPWWYADLQRESHRKFWAESYGEGFYDWYRETQVESAKGILAEPTRRIQLPLPGFSPVRDHHESYLIDSF
ncbi:IS91 family transposase [Rhodopirellula sp. P2]|uniref:IS91 family transposase n=1 Tax=Rhodopirellula sp. P2 TaxID=2127060 RepID=UPI002368C66B|nr:transposase [Rhodopirellula sp. P2]WDQ14948.1 transposase [Rhodopirellula sp. P2]